MAFIAATAYSDHVLSLGHDDAQGFADLGVDAEILEAAQFLHITVTVGNQVHFFCGGGVPTAAAGHVIVVGGDRVIPGNQNINNMKMICKAGSSTISVTFYK